MNNNYVKRESFLFHESKHQMVEADFFPFRNVGKDSEVIQLVQRIQDETGREKDGMFTVYYAQRLIYTERLRFKWIEGAPPYYTNLETFWQMVTSGKTAGDCYLYYIDNIHNIVSNEWQEAMERAHTIWLPPEEKLMEEATDENPADPNS